MAVALITNYLAEYRLPLYRRLSERHGLEVLCYGGGERYVPAWFADLDAQLASAPFPARRLGGAREALALGRRYDAVISPFAGGRILPAAYLGARATRTPFVLWASVWATPRSTSHLVALPLTRQIYRGAGAVVAYGSHVRAYAGRIRERYDDIFVAPQAVEPELFGRPVDADELMRFRSAHDLPEGPLVLYVGRLVREKGVPVLLEAFARLLSKATLVLIGDGPLAGLARGARGVRLLAPVPRAELAPAYAAASVSVLASVPSPRFQEPWGLVVNEAMHAGRPVIVSDTVGAAAGGLVRHEETGLVVPAGDAGALAAGIDRLLADAALARRLGEAGREAVAGYTYDAMAEAFARALVSASS